MYIILVCFSYLIFILFGAVVINWDGGSPGYFKILFLMGTISAVWIRVYRTKNKSHIFFK